MFGVSILPVRKRVRKLMTRPRITACPGQEFCKASTVFSCLQAAVVQSSSNGPVEGPMNRLKTLERQTYGRAGFELLRALVYLSRLLRAGTKCEEDRQKWRSNLVERRLFAMKRGEPRRYGKEI
jgi:hypothetical protein